MSEDLPIREGETVLVWRGPKDSVLLPATRGPQTVPSRGVVDLSEAIGRPPGSTVQWAGAAYRVVRPNLADRLGQLRRGPQIITPKDAPQLLRLAGVSPGVTVAEAGAGSGALAVAIADAIGPDGHLVSYDRRAEFLDLARENLRRSGLADRVELRCRDVVADGFDCGPVNSVILDLPEPWAALPAARSVLVPGGSIATFTPTYNQLERTVRELSSLGFVDVASRELLERAIHVGEGGTRPEFEMLGHTGFLTGARWMGPPW